ncbi:chromosomal replication initiator protein DnaA [Candidatus Dependentiae bacterium]|nr:chromosomal replication initiator protein DnaA [Candidatus Dependentiae bacterium]
MVQTIWQEFLKIVKEEVGSNVVETWFKAVCLSNWDANSKIIYLTAPNRFVKDWISAKYMNLFQQHLSRLLNETQIKIILQIQSNGSENITPARQVNFQNLEKTNKIQVVNRTNKSISDQKFSTFVIGPNNKLAFAAAQAVSQKVGSLYNPLFIYGGSGLGKTHLLKAIYNEIKLENKLNVLYICTQNFVNEFINAIRFEKVRQFELKYKTLDVLLIDDIQFLSNKEQTQEIFFNIFNTLQELKKQIVFTSDCLPGNILGLAERIKSRLEGGLIVDIQVPDLETRVAILKKKADVQNIVVSDEVAHFIANRVYSNVRELEGLLIRVIAYASLTGQEITLQLAQNVLGNFKETRQVPADLERIAQIVARHYRCTLQDLKSASRNKSITLARHVAMYFMKKFTDSSLKDIGIYWCRKDHSTVIHALEKIEQNKIKNESLVAELGRIEHEISA